MCDLTRKYATLKIPYKGYRQVEVIERSGIKWIVEICGNGLQLEVYDDEFELDE